MLGCDFVETTLETDIEPMDQVKSERRAELLDGAAVAEQITAEVKAHVAEFARQQVRPGLAAVRVGDDAASAVYVRNKVRACEEVGIRSEHHALPATPQRRNCWTWSGR